MNPKTYNPMPSKSPCDAIHNIEALDEFTNSQEPTYEDRFDQERQTLSAMKAGMEDRFQETLLKIGYEQLGDYAAGLEITKYNQIFRHEGEWWRASASLELPYTTTGNWATESGLFVGIGEALLRQELADTLDPDSGAVMVAKSPITFQSVSDMESFSGPSDRAYFLLSDQGFGSTFSLEPANGRVADGGMLFAAAGGMLFVRQSDHVAPEFFGSAINNLIPAAHAAALLGLPLRTGPNVYALDTSFLAPDGLVWHCNDTKITQNSDRADAAGFAPGSNTVQTGRLTITMGEYPGPGVGRAAVRIDDTQNRTAVVSNVSLGTIVCLGGHDNANGVAVMGGARKIRIKRIECPDTAKYGRPFIAHWGNFPDHYYDAVDGVYKHVPDALPTTHPNDIIIDEIVCGTLSHGTGDVAAAFLSAAYDVEIKKVTADISSTATTASIVTVSAGDLGFAYSNLMTIRMRDIKFGNISGTTSANAYREIGRALYADFDETPQPSDNYLAWFDVNVNSIDARGISTAGDQNNCLVLTNGEGRTHIGRVRASEFFRVVFSGNLSTNVFIDLISARRIRDNVLHLLGYGSDTTLFPRSYYIGRLELDDWGRDNVSPEGRRAIRTQKILGVFIESVYVNFTGSGLDILLTDTSTGGKGIGIGNIYVLDPAYNLTYVITNQNPASDPVISPNVVDVSGSVTIAMNGGVSFMNRGRFREFTVIGGGGGVLPGLSVSVGDRIVAQQVASGQPFEWYVTGAGTTGADATVVAVSTRA